MADKKRKTKKKGKTGAESGNSAENSFFWLVSGWFLFAVGIILLLGCISSVYSGSEGNWLGPFFGKMIPDTFTFFFGRLPVIFFTLALVLWGLFIALDNLRERLLSFCIGMTLLTLDLSCLLSLKSYGMTGLSRETLFSNGARAVLYAVCFCLGVRDGIHCGAPRYLAYYFGARSGPFVRAQAQAFHVPREDGAVVCRLVPQEGSP